ncbi:hypothetical protein TFLX_00036 [Thermoflexales bacterium]|nr:hypothetical protein TFLX_00036 [Thermoflexales bacterium]
MRNYKAQQDFMKSVICDDDLIAIVDIAHGVPQPSFRKPIAANACLVDLPVINSETAPQADFFACTTSRISRRAYTQEPLSLFGTQFSVQACQRAVALLQLYESESGLLTDCNILQRKLTSPPNTACHRQARWHIPLKE